MANDKRQAKALKKNFRRLAFQACGQCGERGVLFVPYYPKLMGCWRWCYNCGAKDADTQAGGVDLHSSVVASVMAMGHEEARRELIELLAKERA